MVRGNSERDVGFALAADIPGVRGEWVVRLTKGGRMLTRALMISKEGRKVYPIKQLHPYHLSPHNSHDPQMIISDEAK